MNKQALSRQRPGVILIGLLILVVLVIISGLVWYAFWGKPSKQTGGSPTPTVSVVASSPTSSSAADPYAGWKQYTLKYEKFSFKYPASWKVADTSGVDSNSGVSSDKVKVSSPDGFVVSFTSNAYGIGGACDDCKTYSTEMMTSLGESVGFNIYGSSAGAYGVGIDRVLVSGTWMYDCFGLCSVPGKNVTNPLNNNQPGPTLVSGGYPTSSSAGNQLGVGFKVYPVATFKADPNVANSKLIFASMKY